MTKEEIGRILKEMRTAAGMTQKEVANSLGKSQQIVGHWETGYSQPDANMLFVICDLYGADINEAFGFTTKNVELTKHERSLLDAYRNAHEMRPAVDKLLDVTQAVNKVTAPVPLPPPIEDEPEPDEYTVYEMPASAGLGNYLDADPPSEQYIFPAGTVPPGTDFGVRISGDSMEPTIADGSIAFVEECLELRNGEIGIFSLDGEAYCKELYVDRERQEVRLISRNEDYEPITVTINEYTDLRTVGRVLGWWAEE